MLQTFPPTFPFKPSVEIRCPCLYFRKPSSSFRDARVRFRHPGVFQRSKLEIQRGRLEFQRSRRREPGLSFNDAGLSFRDPGFALTAEMPSCLHACTIVFYKRTATHAYRRAQLAPHSKLFSIQCHISTHLLNSAYVQKKLSKSAHRTREC